MKKGINSADFPPTALPVTKDFPKPIPILKGSQKQFEIF